VDDWYSWGIKHGLTTGVPYDMQVPSSLP
jgi:hypothetical protein